MSWLGTNSPFKNFDSIVNSVSKTIKDAEKVIDKAIGIPEENQTTTNGIFRSITPILIPFIREYPFNIETSCRSEYPIGFRYQFN